MANDEQKEPESCCHHSRPYHHHDAVVGDENPSVGVRIDNMIHAAFTTPKAPGSFGGVRKLQRVTGESKKKVVKYLSGQDAYTLHKPRMIHFLRRKTYSKGIADLYQADLVDLSNISHHNDGYRYLLTCIDVFSKKAWAVPLRTKSSRDVANAFENILFERRCTLLQTDKGTEFLSATFQNMLKRHNVTFYTSQNDDIKAAVVERFNRTLKTKMYKFFTFKSTRRYLDDLQNLIDSYNSTKHRAIGMAPNDVNETTEELVRSRLYPIKNRKTSTRWRYNVGDAVRISRRKGTFDKSYEGNWSREIFKIDSRLPTVPVTYTLTDLMGESIKGRFYQPEIQKITHRQDEQFAIDKIIKTRRRGGKVQYFVSWVGYPAKFNSWIDEFQSI